MEGTFVGIRERIGCSLVTTGVDAATREAGELDSLVTDLERVTERLVGVAIIFYEFRLIFFRLKVARK